MSNGAIARQAIAHRGRRLEYFTIAWNALEGLIGVSAGFFSGSISLIGFGIDSFIEVTSGATLLWRMSVDEDVERRERNENLCLRIVGMCFIVPATYIAYEAISDLAWKTAPAHSIAGIVLACISLVVMPILSRAKRKVGTWKTILAWAIGIGVVLLLAIRRAQPARVATGPALDLNQQANKQRKLV